MTRKIDVLSFSATGNTELVVKNISDTLKENGIEVGHQSLTVPYIHNEGTELLLAFPVNSQAVSPFIWKALKALPEGNKDKAYVVITMNESAAILKPLYKLLTKKGYQPVGCMEISMPNNLMLGPDETIDRLSAGTLQARRFAELLVKNETEWKETKKGSAFVSFLSRKTVLPWISMRMINKLDVDKDKCTKCGLCAKACPVENIKMEDYPVHGNQCQFCMHCGAVCPNKAVILKNNPKCQIRQTK